MLHHSRQRHIERLREFADGHVRMRGQTRKERTPRGVGQRGEGAIQCVFIKLNHEVNYRALTCDVKHVAEIFSGVSMAVGEPLQCGVSLMNRAHMRFA
jgi:hypothetical protein